MVDVTKANFLAQLGDFLRHLPAASFVALDEEMTGISIPGSRQRRPNKVELPGERYARQLKDVPERYSILQVGVALFHKNPKWNKKGGTGRDRAYSSGSSHRGLGAAGVGSDPIDEHAYMHREGMLNQDELEDVTEREEDEEIAAAEEEIDDGDEAGEEDDSDADEEAPEYTSRTYNFYLFPSGKSDREVTMNPSTVKFLLDNNMDFDKVFREGITFTTVEQANYLKMKYFERYSKRAEDGEENGDKKGSGSTPRKDRVKLTRVEDIALVARTMAGLREWIDSDNNSTQNPLAEATGDGDVANGEANGINVNGNGASNRNEEGTSLILPPCNAFLRRCLYETIEDEYPGLVLERADADPNHAGVARNQIRVIRLSPAEKKRRDARMQREAWEKLLREEIGFTTIFQAISDACNGKLFTTNQTAGFLDGTKSELCIADSGDATNGGRKIPLIIHNGLQDLMFLMTHCNNTDLPESFEDTKKIIRGYFPAIYDTKVLGTEYSDAIIRGGSTALGELYSVTCNTENSDDAQLLKLPPIVNQEGEGSQQAHEAAYDAYMTGCVFNALCNRILEPTKRINPNVDLDGFLFDSSAGLLREWIGLNKLYMHASLFTIDLESSSGLVGLHDPLSSGLSENTTFHVNGITTSVSTRDILQALTSGNESEEEAIRSLKYEIIWVDDASFFVGTRMDDKASNSVILGLVASHVRNKLYDGLGNNMEILSLVDYFKKKYHVSKEADSVGIVGSLASVAAKPFQALGSALGIGKKRANGDSDGASEGASKRRKMG